MEQNIIQTDIHRAVETIKVAILQTRRKVMIQANKDSLALNYSIGGLYHVVNKPHIGVIKFLMRFLHSYNRNCRDLGALQKAT